MSKRNEQETKLKELYRENNILRAEKDRLERNILTLAEILDKHRELNEKLETKLNERWLRRSLRRLRLLR